MHSIAQDSNRSAFSYLQEGDRKVTEGKFAEAIDLYSKGIWEKPNCVECYYKRSAARLKNEQPVLALDDLLKIISLTPEDYSLYNQIAHVYQSKRYYVEAIYYYNLCIKYNPSFEPAYVNRGACKEILDRFEDARKDFEKALELDPNDPDGHFDLADLLFQDGNNTEALEQVNKAIELNAQDYEYYVLRGNILEELKKPEEAITDFSSAIDLNPSKDNLYVERGIAHTMLGEFKLALRDFDKALEMNPENADAYFEKSMALNELNKKKESRDCLSKAILLNADYATPQMLNAIDAFLSGDKAKACDTWRKTPKKNLDYFKAEEFLKIYCK